MTTDEGTAAPSRPPLSTVSVVAVSAVMVLTVTLISVAIFVAAEEDDDDNPRRAPTVTVTDDFDRGSGGGFATTDAPWEQVSGRWSADGQARLVQPNPDGPRSLALYPALGSNGTLTVRATAVAAGWAVAFRARDQLNYYALVARPNAGSWAVEQVAGGQVTQIPGVVASAPADGDVVTIAMDGTAVTIQVNEERTTIELPATSAADAAVGLLSVNGVPADLAWDDLTFTRTRTVEVPIITAADPAG